MAGAGRSEAEEAPGNAALALTGRFSRAREKAAKELEPDTQSVEVPRRTLKTTGDFKAWLDDTGKVLNEAVAKGPVVIK